MDYSIIKLHFTSPLHLSRGQTEFYDKSETVLHSDTIKSAIFSCAKIIYKVEINKDFLSSFSISSAFPFIDNEFFFPKPLLNFNPIIRGIDDGPKTHKKLKKIEYLTKEVFEHFINGNLQEIDKNQISENDKYLFSSENKVKTVYKTQPQQRLVMPIGDEKNPTPYYLDRIYFNNGAGLFFLIIYKDEKTEEKVLNSLKLLETQGLGTDRNVGNGQFKFKQDNISLNLPDEKTLFTNLSLYLPEEKETKSAFDKDSRYKLLKRGGYISNPEDENFLSFRKKSIFMLKEGSVFTSGDLKGKIENLKPDKVDMHPVYRDGTSIFIPINPKQF